MPRVLLLIPTASYKATDFLDAARRLGIEVVVGAERRAALTDEIPGRFLTVDFAAPGRALPTIVRAAEKTPFDAVIGTDDESVGTAALAARALGHEHNPPEAVERARDKHLMRERLRRDGIRTPWFVRLPVNADPVAIASDIRYPCVLKPLALSASRGVLRADDAREFSEAFGRVASILADPEVAARGASDRDHILVEGFLPGREVALEGMLRNGALHALALFDKPDAPDGPTFEETMLVTPSRLPPDVQAAVVTEVQSACAALGLGHGPVHAELRVNADVPWVLEIAPRTIGGLCSRALRFATGATLEEIVLREMLGSDDAPATLVERAAGILMIPVRRAGRFRRLAGVERARRIPGVTDVTVSVALDSQLVPLPEGHRYVGFVFASGSSAADVECSLREAARVLEVEVD